MKEQWEKNNAGADNAGKPLFLGGEADIKRLGLNPNELSFLTSKGVTLEDICILTGVPKEILGTTSGSTYANADASIAIFLRERIRPLLQELTTLLDWRLIPADLDLSFVDPTPEDMDRKLKTAETLNTINALTTNEKREMFGFDEVKGGDDILVPFSLSPLTQPKAEATKEVSKKGTIDHNPLSDKTFRKKYAEVMVKRMDKRETKFLKVMQEYFDGQEARLVDSLGGRKQFKVKNLLGEIFDNALEIQIAKNTILPIIKQIVMETGIEAYKLVADGKPYNFVFSSEIESWLNEKSAIFANQINDTTFEKLKKEFSNSFEAGETRQDLIARIQNTYGDFDDKRAKMIARTEVHGATTKGPCEG
jgi:hypothetical protein